MARIILLRLLESFFKRWLLWLVPILVMGGVGVLHFLTAAPVYISSSALYVNKESLLASFTSIREDGFSWVTPAQSTVDEFKELLQTDAFTRSVIQLSDLEKNMSGGAQGVADTIVEARNSIWINTLGKNTIFIGAAHKDPRIAQQLADGTIQVYIQWKINSNREESAAAVMFSDTLVTRYDADVQAAEEALRTYLDDHPVPVRGSRVPSEQVEIDSLERTLSIATSRYRTALDDRESSQQSLAVADSQIHHAYILLDAPRYPIASNKSLKSGLMDALIYVVVGMFLSMIGMIGTALLDSSIHFPMDVRHHLELPVLTSVPWDEE